ncbi:MAG TPA: SRPBCC family protein [Solirubrobacterales bacterium]|nr:SRPBCC family protein [Solirubrobacterales bacterium]
MGLRFEHVFTVRAPADRVWAYLSDPYRVAPALPGAAITEKVDERTFKGTLTVKVGPVSARYKGTARFDSLDSVARTMEMTGSAQDVTGRGGADLKMSSRLVEKAPAETEVSVVSETSVTGILAQFGRGMIQDVSNQMFQRFTEAVRAELEQPAATEPAETEPAAPTAAPPIEVVSFGGQLVGRAALRAVRRPGFLLIAAVVLLVILWSWMQ